MRAGRSAQRRKSRAGDLLELRAARPEGGLLPLQHPAGRPLHQLPPPRGGARRLPRPAHQRLRHVRPRPPHTLRRADNLDQGRVSDRQFTTYLELRGIELRAFEWPSANYWVVLSSTIIPLLTVVTRSGLPSLL